MPDIERRLINYLTRTASKEDLDVLSEWIKNPESKKILKSYAKTHFVISRYMTKSDGDKIREELIRKIRKDKFAITRRTMLKYTGVIIVLVSLGYWFYSTQLSIPTFSDTHEKIVIKDENITIKLGDGSVRTIDVEKSSQIVSSAGKILGNQNGKGLVYTSNATEELVYNELYVPYGKRFELTLSDGTKVFLNAGTSLKYPINFIEGMPREVYLKEGEAFFEVTTDELHPFRVNAPVLDVEVLGTRFNVMAYPEDENSEIVLVEGSVKMKSNISSDSSNETILRPGIKGSLKKASNTISIENVNTSIYTSWVNGNIVFRKSPFNNIIKKLERHYNLTIINNNETLSDDSRTFNATVELDRESINDVLDYFQEIYQIEYTVINNKVIIN
ncbi:FecR family protein [Flagellimonas onchidii]|uniref:FecR family protein n=1 Tax=Flagellimonas onchidii TaxID=2562684 RepID=UPI0010A6A90A|nr:FecR family protein [Allomuricauda onchidii]